MPMYFCCVGVFACLVLCTVWCAPFGCVPVVAWLNSNDGSRHLLVHGVRGVWLNMFHVCFLASPSFLTPSGWGLVVEPCNFWIFCQSGACLGVGWFVFGWVLGFSRPVSAETYFVESLILAQDERWRRA